MATTKVWAITDSLSRVLNYVENKEKTEIKNNDLQSVIAYTSNASKTENMSYVSGINLEPSLAYKQMTAVKKQFNKEDGVLAFHGYHSFHPGEVDAITAHKMTRELMERWLGDDFQVLLCTHLDHDHIHTHFVINSVSWTTGKRFLNQHKDYRRLRELSDGLSKEYGLSVIEKPKFGKSYAEVNSERLHKASNRRFIREDVDFAISQSITWKQFLRNLENMGYKIKIGKHIAISPPNDSTYFYRLKNLCKDEDYSELGIKEKIIANSSIVKKVSNDKKVYRTKGPLIPHPKIKGIRALYYRYLYELGILPKHSGKKNIHPVIKKDLLKLDQITKEVTFMAKKQISTIEDLDLFESNAKQVVSSLSKQNRSLCNKINRCEDLDTKISLYEKHDRLMREIAVARKEVKLYKSIRTRSQTMKDKLMQINNEYQPKERQQKKYIR